MAAREERRDYSRIAADVAVRWLAVQVDKPTRDYLDELARNISPRGLFIESEHPPATGTVLRLEIRVQPRDGEPHSVFAKAIVRWRQRWSRPRGMGVEFVEFEGLGERKIGEWLESILRSAEATAGGESSADEKR